MSNEQDQLLEKIAHLESQVRDLESDLIHDSLTGLKTRAFFEEELGVYLEVIGQNEKGKRKEWFGFRNVSIIFFDIDHFKKVNDTYGHDVGDAVLAQVAQSIKQSLRTGDTASRWGGEEMVASMIGASESDAKDKADEIREKVKTLTFSEAPELRVTISAGVASSEKGIELSELVKRADQALYKAKDSGRDQVITFGEIN